MREDKRIILKAYLNLLRATSNAGSGNSVVDILLIEKNGMQYARPIFEDGNGKDGYYDVNISGDSGTAIIKDLTDNFVCRVW